MAISMKIEAITPEMAKDYLKKNSDNYRKIYRNKVHQYAKQMKDGQWQLNGEAICFDENGQLKNGQHRLAAIMQAGVTVDMAVIRGVGSDITIYDSGHNRTIRQISGASGVEVTNTEAAAARILCVGYSTKNAATTGEVLDWINNHASELHRAYLLAKGGKNSMTCNASCLVAVFLMLDAGMQSFEVDAFCRIINTGNTIGTDGYEPSPALVARRMLEKYKGMTGSSYTIGMEKCEIMVQAMTDFRKGKTRQLNYKLADPMVCNQMLDAYLRKEHGNG